MQQAAALVNQVQSGIATASPTANPTPVNSSQVEFLFDLATSAFWGPPQPPPAFAIANLINSANNGSVDPRVIADVLYDIALYFDPTSVMGGAAPDSSPDSSGSLLLQIAGDATDEAVKNLVGDLAGTVLQGIGVTDPGLIQGTQSFLGGFSGSVLSQLIEGKLTGTSVLNDLTSQLLSSIFR